MRIFPQVRFTIKRKQKILFSVGCPIVNLKQVCPFRETGPSVEKKGGFRLSRFLHYYGVYIFFSQHPRNDENDLLHIRTKSVSKGYSQIKCGTGKCAWDHSPASDHWKHIATKRQCYIPAYS